MVSSPRARLEGILGCAGLPMGGGRPWDPARAGRARRAEEGPGRPRGSRAPRLDGPGLVQVPGGALPPTASRPCTLRPPGRGPGTPPPPLPSPAYAGRPAGGRAGDGQSRTPVRRGSGANRSPAMGRRELGAVAFTAEMCVRVVAVVLL